MPWRKQVEQWRQYAIWEGQGAPPDLILSIINNESAGRAGIPAGVGTKFHLDVPKRAGGNRLVKRAYGLMQTIPAVISDFNKDHGAKPAYWEDVSGKTAEAGRIQIRIGCWLFNKYVRLLHKYDPVSFPGSHAGEASPEQLTSALVAYAVGWGALRKKFDVLKEKGVPLTQRNLYENFPLWGYSKSKERWVNRPLHYGAKLWARYQRNKTNDPGIGPPENPSGQPPETVIATGPKKKPWMGIDTDVGVPILLLVGAIVATKLFGKNESS